MATRKPVAPTITMPTLKKGEHYAGIVLKDGQIKGGHHLILLPGEAAKLTYEMAMAWAKKKGAELPDRIEARLLWANQSAQFKTEWYWAAVPYAGDDAYAWGQSFTDGDQDCWDKPNELRARAVRRFVIESFTPSIA
jgi:hypothetical protein